MRSQSVTVHVTESPSFTFDVSVPENVTVQHNAQIQTVIISHDVPGPVGQVTKAELRYHSFYLGGSIDQIEIHADAWQGARGYVDPEKLHVVLGLALQYRRDLFDATTR